MSRILQLDPLLANQIAAGEVIERPASVVKELVENSLDANATQIEIEIEGGGIHLIRVHDNGKGILKDDLELAFSRHATSKIRALLDLTTLASLGFRGEALASIACAARCRLISRAEQAEHAWQIQIQPDLSTRILPAAHAIGTTVEVNDLFYNTPVRRKFLRSEKTEFQAIEEVVKRLALSHENVSFRLMHQGRLIRTYAKATKNNLEGWLEKIVGKQFVAQAVPLSFEATGLQLKGWLGLPQLNRRQADGQYFFINQRMVKDRLLMHAIKMVYQAHPDYQEGTYPAYVLYLNLDPKEVDVNVHPTKQEVRFSEARWVHDFITKCAKEAFSKNPIDVKKVISHAKASLPTSLNRVFVSEREKGGTFLFTHYAVLEEESDLIIIALQRVKKNLLSAYFEKYAGHIPTKTLLFPVFFPQLSDELIQALRPFGFEFDPSAKGKLLKKPAILASISDLNQILLSLETASLAALAKQLGEILPFTLVTLIDSEVLLTLLKEEKDQFPAGSFFKLTVATIEAALSGTILESIA